MKKIFPLGILFLSFIVSSFSQGWEKIYFSEPEVTDIRNIMKTPDGGYVFAGTTTAAGAGGEDGFLMKVDANGEKLWFRTYGGPANDAITGFTETSEGYMLVGRTRNFGGTYNRLYLVRTDFNGVKLKDTAIHAGSLGDDIGWGVIRTKDHGYLIHSSTPVSSLFYQANTIKLDSNFSIVWDKHYGSTGVEYIYNMIQTLDGGFIGIGTTSSYGATANGDIYILKLDSLGNEQWYRNYSGSGTDVGFKIYQNADSSYFAGARVESYGAGGADLYLFSLDKSGNMKWNKTYGTANFEYHGYFCKSKSGGFYITATHNAASTSVPGDLWLIKVQQDSAKFLWDKKYGYRNDLGRFMLEEEDGGLVIVGTSSNGTTQRYVYLVRTDASGNSITNEISGTVFHDANENCILDVGERKIPNVLIRLEPGPGYITTDTTGIYSVKVGQGTFTLTEIVPHSSLEVLCPAGGSHTVSFASNNYLTSFNKNFANKGQLIPVLTVDLSTPRLRRCFQNTYRVSYCNTGTATASNVEIKLEFPEAIIPLNASTAWVQNGNIYTVSLGSLNPGQCGSFTVTDSVSCIIPLGSTHCVRATISSSTIPPPDGDPGWDKSSVKVEGNCEGDTIKFIITNTGEPGDGNMDGPSEFRIYEDNHLVYTGTFQINGGQSQTIAFASNGKTYRLEADQRPGHPGNSRPRETVEGCGTGPSGEVSFGFVNQVAQDDADIFVEEDCQTVIGSFDPNDKAVVPQGVTNNHYIGESDELEYTIRFQNTGTDTAFTVIIRDTLSQTLDVSTFKTLSASHPFSYKIYGNGSAIVEWKFSNILLPDSNINEPKSHGFVKFKINQAAGNPKGTVIENRAGIIFDFNEPVITNTTHNIVYDTTIAGSALLIVTGTKKALLENTFIRVEPNPFNDITHFKISSVRSEFMLELYDLSGKLLQRHSFSGNDYYLRKDGLNSGMYIYKIFSGEDLAGAGKIILE